MNIEIEEKKIIAGVIIDLYELRVPYMDKYQKKSEKVIDMFKYNFFTSAIAHISNKYQITLDLIEEVQKERTRNEIPIFEETLKMLDSLTIIK